MAQPAVSILIPHYQTPQLTRLCLRLLRRHGRQNDIEVVVIDNGSQDDSAAMLAEFAWPRVLRRTPDPDERPACSHGRALDLGVQETNAPLILVMHTDTMVVHDDWLNYLQGELQLGGERCGSVGSWKMEVDGIGRRIGKWVENLPRQFSGKIAPQVRYPRSHCALYRRRALQDSHGTFDPGPTGAAGEGLATAMAAHGWSTRLVNPSRLGQYVRHLNHATMALNRHFGAMDRNMPRTRARSIRRIEGFFATIDADELLADPTLCR